MSYSKPIWNDVTACNYKSSKSYGNINDAETTISVGSSSKNSHVLVTHFTTRRFKEEYKGLKSVCVFKFGIRIDNKETLLSEKIFKDNKGRAGELLKTNHFL